MTHSRLPLLPLFLAAARGYKFSLATAPTQCGDLTVNWSGGQAPYELVLVPVGHVTPEIRTIVDQKVDSGSSTSLQLKFPKGSQFVAVLSDASGVGAGGTSDVLTVGDGPSDCLSGPVQAKWVLYMDNTSPGACASTQVGWDATAQGPVSLWGIVPAGQSFDMNPPSSGTSFDWTPGVKEGTKMMVLAGDSQGRGTGGSSDIFAVTSGGGAGCITGDSPSTTSGPAAGQVAAVSQTQGSGSSPTASVGSATASGSTPSATSSNGGNNGNDNVKGGSSASGDADAADPSNTAADASQQSDSSNSSSKHHVPIAAIVLPVLAALLLLLLGLFFFLRSRRRRTRSLAQSSFDNMRGRGDLLASHPPSIAGSAGVDSVLVRAPHENMPRGYETEPFVMRPRGGADLSLQRTRSGGGYSADVSDAASMRELLAPSPLATPTGEKAAYLQSGFLHANPFVSPLDPIAPSHSPPSFRTVATGGHSPRPGVERRLSDRNPARRTGTLYSVTPTGVGLSTSTLNTLAEGEVPPTYDSWQKHAGSDAGHLAGHQGLYVHGDKGSSSGH